MVDADWLASLPVIGNLPPEVAAVKLREVGEDELAQALEDASGAAPTSFGVLSRLGIGRDRAWQHTDAANAYQQALQLYPSSAVPELAVVHTLLAAIYAQAGDTDTSLRHSQQAIHYEERQDDRYGAGQSRYNAALALRNAGRNREALLYAQASLRDFQAVGPGAAVDAEDARKLITQLEQKPAHEPDGGGAGPAR